MTIDLIVDGGESASEPLGHALDDYHRRAAVIFERTRRFASGEASEKYTPEKAARDVHELAGIMVAVIFHERAR